MIDPATRWFERIKYKDKKAATIENLVGKTWICRYPRPKKIHMTLGMNYLVMHFKTIDSKTNTG